SLNPLGLLTGQFGVSRDMTGEVSAITSLGGGGVPEGVLWTASHDQAGRLTALTSDEFFPDQRLGVGLEYDGFGRKKQVTHSTGLVGTYAWDGLNRMTSISWSGPSVPGGAPESVSLNLN